MKYDEAKAFRVINIKMVRSLTWDGREVGSMCESGGGEARAHSKSPTHHQHRESGQFTRGNKAMSFVSSDNLRKL